MSDRALDPVRKHLQEHPHPHVTPEMLASHATVVDDPDSPDAIVFDVEKRQNALGARHHEDRPLAAYQTHWERYCYDPEREDLYRLGTNVGRDQNSTVTINSFSQLAKDHLVTVLDLFKRAWP